MITNNDYEKAYNKKFVDGKETSIYKVHTEEESSACAEQVLSE